MRKLKYKFLDLLWCIWEENWNKRGSKNIFLWNTCNEYASRKIEEYFKINKIKIDVHVFYIKVMK